jgi:hypothetical protein
MDGDGLVGDREALTRQRSLVVRGDRVALVSIFTRSHGRITDRN